MFSESKGVFSHMDEWRTLKKEDKNHSTLVLYILHEIAKEFYFVFYLRFDVFYKRKKKDS